MLETIGAAGTLAGIVLLFRAWRSEKRQTEILLKDFAKIATINRQLGQIATVHGCAPSGRVHPEGSTHHCQECGTTWTAQDFQVEWLDDGLKNRLTQAWHLTAQDG